jgi:hypothetical protein
MNEPKTKDGTIFKIGMPLVTQAGVKFSTVGYELEFAHGHWTLFRKGQDQGFKLTCFYSSPAARFADKLRQARARREFWAAEESRYAEFANPEVLPDDEKSNYVSDN